MIEINFSQKYKVVLKGDDLEVVVLEAMKDLVSNKSNFTVV